jgi:hypothetical protein
VHAVTRYVDDPHKLLSQPAYDRELGKCLDLNWSYSTRGAKLYPTTLAWFAREHLTPNEPRYRPTGAVLRPTPQVLVPHPLTGGPIATGRRQLLIERRGEEWVDREEVERATLQPAGDEVLKDLVRSIGINTLAEQAKVNYRKLRRWLVGKQNLGPRRRAKVLQALHSILSAQAQARTVLRAHPNKAELARRLGVDRKTLWRYKTGARPIPPDLLPRILTPGSPQPRRKPREAAGTSTGPQHPTRRQATQAAQTRRRTSPDRGQEDRRRGGPTHPGTPSGTRDRSGGPAGRARSERQKERESTDPK